MLDLDGEVRTVRQWKHLCSARFIRDLQRHSQMTMWKAKYLMKEFENICRKRVVLGVEERIDATNLDQCYEASFRVLVERVYSSDAMTGRHLDKKMYGTYSYITYCNGMHKGNKDTPRRQEAGREKRGGLFTIPRGRTLRKLCSYADEEGLMNEHRLNIGTIPHRAWLTLDTNANRSENSMAHPCEVV
eukprot:765095-Hanusia_phi.AAC.1